MALLNYLPKLFERHGVASHIGVCATRKDSRTPSEEALMTNAGESYIKVPISGSDTYLAMILIRIRRADGSSLSSRTDGSSVEDLVEDNISAFSVRHFWVPIAL
jgi:hypothetical protein